MSSQYTPKPSTSSIVSLPSVSCALSALPQAKSLSQVALHPSTLANRNVESEAKVRFCFLLSYSALIIIQLRKAISVTSQNQHANAGAANKPVRPVPVPALVVVPAH